MAKNYTNFLAKSGISTQDIVNSEKAKEEGNEFIKNGNYEKALECYNKAISLNPENSILYCNRSTVYLKEESFEKAIEDCTKALDIKNDYIKAYQRRGKAYIGLKNYGKAIFDLTKVVENEIDDKDSFIDLKACNEILVAERKIKKTNKVPEKNEPKLVRHDLKENEFFDDEPYLGKVLSKAYVIQDNANKLKNEAEYNSAIDEYYRALELVLNVITKNLGLIIKAKVSIFMSIASCFVKKQDFESAIMLLDKIFELGNIENKIKSEAFFNKGICFDYLEDYEKALENMKKSDIYQPSNKIVQSHIKKYETLLKSDPIKLKISESELEKLLKSLNYYKDTGNMFFKKNDLKNSTDEFNKGIKEITSKYPEEVILSEKRILSLLLAFYNNRALVHYKKKKYDLAVQDCLEVLRLQKNNPKALYRCAKCYEETQNYEDAFKSAKKAIESDPENPAILQDFKNYLEKVNDHSEINEPQDKSIEKIEQTEIITNVLKSEFKSTQKVDEPKNEEKKNEKIEQAEILTNVLKSESQSTEEVKPKNEEKRLEKMIEDREEVLRKPKKSNQKLQKINKIAEEIEEKTFSQLQVPKRADDFIKAVTKIAKDQALLTEYFKVMVI